MHELTKIEFNEGKIRLFINDEVHQEMIVLEIKAGEFFDKLASAFYSARADKAVRSTME
jgi:hypothetical protein